MIATRWQLAYLKQALRSWGQDDSRAEEILGALGMEVEPASEEAPMPDPRLPSEPGSLIEIYEIDREPYGPELALLGDNGEWYTLDQSVVDVDITGFRIMVATPVDDICTEPAGLWRAIGPYDSHAWAESSNRDEVLRRLRPRDRFEQLYTSTPTTTWKEEPR